LVWQRQVGDLTPPERYFFYGRIDEGGNSCKKCNCSTRRQSGSCTTHRVLQPRRHHFRRLSRQLNPCHPLPPMGYHRSTRTPDRRLPVRLATGMPTCSGCPPPCSAPCRKPHRPWLAQQKNRPTPQHRSCCPA